MPTGVTRSMPLPDASFPEEIQMASLMIRPALRAVMVAWTVLSAVLTSVGSAGVAHLD